MVLLLIKDTGRYYKVLQRYHFWELKMCKNHVIGNFVIFFYQVDEPRLSPLVLKGHTGEVSVVGWCPDDMTKVNISIY